jgi:hypothetical protein
MNTQTKPEYLLLFRGTGWQRSLSPEEIQNVTYEKVAWFARLTVQGNLRAKQPLLHDGKIVYGKHGKFVADGFFEKSEEAIGGYLLLQADTLKEAVDIAKESPGLGYGESVEVRPVALH